MPSRVKYRPGPSFLSHARKSSLIHAIVLMSLSWLILSVAHAVRISPHDVNLPGARDEFVEGENWRYGRRQGDARVGKEGNNGELLASEPCHGEDVYQTDIVMDSWSRSFLDAEVSHGIRKSHTEDRKLTHGLPHQDQYRHGRRQHYMTKKAARVEMDRRMRRDLEATARVRRGATAQEARLWPGGVVPYEIDADCDGDTKNLVLRSMLHWQEHTCIRFVPRTNETAYVFFSFTSLRGCCSPVGRAGGRQVVSLGPGCVQFGTIIHELGHVVGFWHEQSRPDRDDYVTIYEVNVWPGEHFNFRLLDHRVINSLDQPYDYESAMHYGSHAFSRNREHTIIPKNDQAIGQRGGLSVGDILQANLLYRCTRKGECGGTIFKASGQLTSPHYPEPYAPNMTCDWAISVNDDKALKFIFVDIDLPNVAECSAGYVELRDGQGELGRLIGRYCGSTLPAPVTMDSGRVWLRFWAGTSAEFQSLVGFAAKFHSVSFDKPLTASRGTLKSQNYPGTFPPNTNSVWQITVADGFVVTLRILELLIPVSSETGCYGDYLKIIDGDSSQSPMITKICLTQTNVGVSSTGRSLRIEMHSGKPERRGNWDQPTRFHAQYLQRDLNECRTKNGGCEQACLNVIGTYLCGCLYGYVLADNYHNCTDIDECLDNNGGCSDLCVNTEGAYHCACPEGLYLSPNNKTHCLDEDECDDPNKNGCGQHCYNTIGGYACACSPGFILAPNGKSCVAVENCGGHYGGIEGSFLSPAIPPSDFNNILDCVWRIQVDPAFTVSLRIALSHWVENTPCLDYINFLEGQRATGLHMQICNPDDTHEVYHTNSDLVWVHYRSVWPHGGAFQVEYFSRERRRDSAECGGVLKDGFGTLQSPGYPNAYPNEVHCIWKITGRIIMLNFETFDLEQESRCAFDFLDIQDGDVGEPESRHIGRFCGRTMPPNEVTSWTGEVFIKFQSDATVQATGFKAVFEVYEPATISSSTMPESNPMENHTVFK